MSIDTIANETSPVVDRKRPASGSSISNLRSNKKAKVIEENCELILCQDLFQSIMLYKTLDNTCPYEILYNGPPKENDCEHFDKTSSQNGFVIIQQRLESGDYTKLVDLCQDIENVIQCGMSCHPEDSEISRAATDLNLFYKPEKDKYSADVERTKENTGPLNSSTSTTEIKMNGNMTSTEDESKSETFDQWKLEIILKGIVNLSDESGRMIAPIFKVLETKDEFPEYYKIIQNPVDLKTIAVRVLKNNYKNWEEFESDIELLVSNAKKFNGARSEIGKDAVTIYEFVKKRKDEINKLKRRANKSVLDEARAEVTALANATLVDDEAVLTEDEDDEANGSADNDLSKFYWFLREQKKKNKEYLCNFFFELPLKSQYPEYYEEIEEPMSLYAINNKLKKGIYKKIEELIADFMLICSNAKKFNIESSVIYKDAVTLEKILNEEIEKRSIVLSGTSNKTVIDKKIKKELIDEEFDNTGMVQVARRSKYGNIPGFTPIAGKKGRKSVDERWTIYILRLTNVWNRLCEIYIDNRRIIDPFMQLPPKEHFTHYFPMIQNPIDMITVKKRLEDRCYLSSTEFQNDLLLIFDNAMMANPPNQFIFHDAQFLKSKVLEFINELAPHEPLLSPQSFKEQRKKKVIKDSISIISEDSSISPSPKISKSTIADNVFGETEDHEMTIKIPIGLSKEQAQMYEFFNIIVDYKAPDNRVLSYNFDKLPTKAEYPDYYEEIKKPMDLEKIRQKLINQTYSNINVFLSDMILVFSNACTFNDPESQLYMDAFTLLKLVIHEKDNFDIKPHIPPVQCEVQKILHRLIDEVLSLVSNNGKKVSESLSKLPTLLEQNEISHELWPFTLDEIKANVDRRKYRRVDRLQEDVFYLFSTARKIATPEDTIYEDTVTLQTHFISQRDDAMKNLLISSARFFTDRQLTDEINATGRKKRTIKGDSEHKDIDVESEGASMKGSVKEEGEGILKNTVKFNNSDSDNGILHPRYEQIISTSQSLNLSNEGTTSQCYEIMQYGRFWLKLGDGVLVFNEKKAYCDVMRIDKLWKTGDGKAYFSGAWFARPIEVVHDESRLFYVNEVFAVDQRDMTVNCDNIQSKCSILTPKQYETERKTEIPECDVFVCEYKVKGRDRTEGYCSLRTGPGKSQGKTPGLSDEFGRGAKPMNLEFSKPIKKLKTYNLAASVVDDEILLLKNHITMEKELSPLIMKTDTTLPADVPDLNDSIENLNDTSDLDHIEIDEETKEKCKDPSWLAQQPKLNAKSKSGYILFSAEVRKRVMTDNPTVGFGEISRMVGAEWKKLTDTEKKQYEVRASYIASERAKQEAEDVQNCKALQPGQIKVFPCKWDTCDYQFDCIDGLMEHLRIVHTKSPIKLSNGDVTNACLWQSCLKYKKEGKPFPSIPRLFRHIKEKHLANAAKAMYPNQRGKNFFVYEHDDITKNGPCLVYTGGVLTKPFAQGGVFKHHPQGIPPEEHPTQSVTPCKQVQHKTPVNNHVQTSSKTLQNGTTQQCPPKNQPSQNGYISTSVPSQSAQQYVQAKMNGNTVLLPVNGQGQQTVVLGQNQNGAPIQMLQVHQQPISSMQQNIVHTYQTQPSNSTANISQPPTVPSTVAYVTPSTNPNIDPGRSVVLAPKQPEPVFVAPPVEAVRVKRALHSDTYKQYLETLHGKRRQNTISKWNKSVEKRTTPGSKFNPFNFIRSDSNGKRPQESDIVKAMWSLRDKLYEETSSLATALTTDITYTNL
uniref:Polybromo (inferred by orthology to a D. melanogaster protein) n=1 Tax=Strongyloides venezuelensis TaxID=75913 RepID=A0A0K0FHB2_STRVS